MATTDEAEVVGFAVIRNGDVTLRVLIDPVWYKPIRLEEDSTITSAHPSAVVDQLGNIWVAWDDGNDIYVSSVNISDMEVDDKLTSVGSDVENRVTTPEAFLLAPNYPNPFNATTTITYDLPNASDVTLTIYTVTGQKVATLVSDHQGESHHRVTWDGEGQASGIYFYRPEAGEFVETKRMALIR